MDPLGPAACFDAAVPKLRVVFPTAWDRQQLAASPELTADLAVEFTAPDDADCAADFDVLAHIDGAIAAWRGDVDAVFSSSDYPGAAAVAAIGTALGLPASRPQDVLAVAHKGLARRRQREVAPAATPAFQVVDPERPFALDPAIGWPCWVKPAKGSFSMLARRVGSLDELRAFLGSPAVAEYRRYWLSMHRALMARHLGGGVDAGEFVVEQELRGHLVTVEVFATGTAVRALGVVDSVRHERTGSFVAFEYPSALPAAVQARMEDLACRVVRGAGLRWTMANVELMWDSATDRLGIVECNPRMCGQFADLYAKVDGVHGHRIAFDLALGREPVVRRGAGAHAFAASFPLRVFEPVRVLRAPTAADRAAAQALFADTLVWNEVEDGAVLAEFALGEDGHSHRHGVVNLGADARPELIARRDAVLRCLDYRFAPVAPSAASAGPGSQPPPSAR